MLYKNEIFISYSHLDNESAFQGQNGWISDFHRALEVRVAQLLGRKPTVWRDPKLTGNDRFTEEISDQLPQTAVLVTILSPRYVKSEWCRREFHSFWENCASTMGVWVGNKSRVFKVVKTPFPHATETADLQPLLQPLLGYEFFKADTQSGHFHELDLAFGPEAKADYWLRLDDLAQDIADLLERMASGSDEVPLTARPAVYLAETAADVGDFRSNVRRDLERKGYTVLPQRSVPLEAEELAQFVRKELAGCVLSIHLVGGHYGIVPDGSVQSIVEVQHDLAVEWAKNNGTVRLVWVPPGIVPQDERERKFIDRLRSDGGWNAKADLLETSIESLKTLIDERLAAIEAAQKKPVMAVAENIQPVRVYLICEEQDKENVLPLRDFLFDQGFEAVLPLFDGEEAEVRMDHEDNLRTCDAAIIYHGLSHDLFLQRKLRELRKIATGPAESRLRMKAVCIAAPMTAEKKAFRTLEAVVILQNNGFEADGWRPLLLNIRSKQATV
jgi:hypothetical protein